MDRETAIGLDEAASFASHLGQADAHLNGAVLALGKSGLHDSEMMAELERLSGDLRAYVARLQPVMQFSAKV